MRSHVVQQFRRPHGVLGHLAGWVIAHRDSNVRRNAWVVSLLDIEPEHHVSELGSGPGVALDRAVALASRGHVVQGRVETLGLAPAVTCALGRRV